MAISAVQSGTTGLFSDATAAADGGSSQFLQLLVTQIQHQDPFSPMDNQEFAAQLAQFSSLEQLQGINAQLSENITISQSLNNTMLLSLVGRNATVPGDGVTVTDGAAGPLRVQAAGGGTATITVRNAAGQVVATYPRELRAGWNDLGWDARLADGTVAPDGQYSYEVTATDRAGNPLTVTTYVTGTVESIRFENGLAIVSVAGRDYYVSEIAQVSR